MHLPSQVTSNFHERRHHCWQNGNVGRTAMLAMTHYKYNWWTGSSLCDRTGTKNTLRAVATLILPYHTWHGGPCRSVSMLDLPAKHRGMWLMLFTIWSLPIASNEAMQTVTIRRYCFWLQNYPYVRHREYIPQCGLSAGKQKLTIILV